MDKIQIGDTIKIIRMACEPNYTNRIGIVKVIDDIGQIHGTWGGLAISPSKDTYEIIKKGNNNG